MAIMHVEKKVKSFQNSGAFNEAEHGKIWDRQQKVNSTPLEFL